MLRKVLAWLAGAVFLCCGLAAAQAQSLSVESLLSQARLLVPELPAPSPASWQEVPPASAQEIYDSIARLPAKRKSLDSAAVQRLWDETFRHPVAGLDDEKKLAKYDPEGFIGFCFGRAMAAHLLARQRGLAEGSVRKLFAVGDLREGDTPEWRFHVATVVKGADGRWQAIDPIMPGPMTAAQWLAEVRKTWDKQNKARFYLTPASAVIPDVTAVPDLDKEKGERVIEISFDPAGKQGFAPSAELGAGVFSVSPAAARRYFKTADGGFDFLGIAINGQPISYNGFFVDMLRDLAVPVRRYMEPFFQRPAAPAARPLGLGSAILGRKR